MDAFGAGIFGILLLFDDRNLKSRVIGISGRMQQNTHHCYKGLAGGFDSPPLHHSNPVKTPDLSGVYSLKRDSTTLRTRLNWHPYGTHPFLLG